MHHHFQWQAQIIHFSMRHFRATCRCVYTTSRKSSFHPINQLSPAQPLHLFFSQQIRLQSSINMSTWSPFLRSSLSLTSSSSSTSSSLSQNNSNSNNNNNNNTNHPQSLSLSHSRSFSTIHPNVAHSDSSLPNPTLLGHDDAFDRHLTPNIDGLIADNYDWSKSSASNYSLKYNPIDFVRFQYSKSLLDYSYHGYYTKERQEKVHNPIIDWYSDIAIHKVKTPEYLDNRPWILFTAGPMGSGKTHSLQWMDSLGVFPLEAFLKISPDRIKKYLPEYDRYLQEDQDNVGRMLRSEAGYLCEVILWEILHSTNVCVWMDSSLQHGQFFKNMFTNIHLRFPSHRIALINVQCDANIVFERAKKRAKSTGRVVPESDIQQSIDAVPESIELLKDLADVLVHVDNSFDSAFHKTPNLMQIQWSNRKTTNSNKPIVIDNPSWDLFHDIWTGKGPQGASPNSKL